MIQCVLVFWSFSGENSHLRSSETGIQNKSANIGLKFCRITSRPGMFDWWARYSNAISNTRCKVATAVSRRLAPNYSFGVYPDVVSRGPRPSILRLTQGYCVAVRSGSNLELAERFGSSHQEAMRLAQDRLRRQECAPESSVKKNPDLRNQVGIFCFRPKLCHHTPFFPSNHA